MKLSKLTVLTVLPVAMVFAAGIFGESGLCGEKNQNGCYFLQ